MSERKQGQEVTSDFAEPWDPKEPGESFEGVYMGTDKVPSGRNKEKPFFLSHRFKIDGQEKARGVAGAFLDRKMSRIPPGTYCWVTFVGAVDTDRGKAKDFKVVAEEGTVLLESGGSNDLPF